jgi:cytochrome c peroxidase
MDEVFVSRMGSRERPAWRQVDALASWLDTIPAPVVAPQDTAAADRGRLLFENSSVGCATCHAGPAFTDNNVYDVGTGAAFAVPSLVGLAARAPYMHDGCAATLTERFGFCGGGDEHGQTSQLSSAQISDLVAYLNTL